MTKRKVPFEPTPADDRGIQVTAEGKRLYLREVLPEDWAEFHPYASDPDTVKYQPWGPHTETDSKFFVRQVLIDARQKYRSRYVFAIVVKADHHVIGNIELNIQDWDGVGEIGFIIHHHYWGRGFATEACGLMLAYSFDHCGLHRVTALSSPENKASQRVLEKIGMVKEGTLREDIFVKGAWRDSSIYGVLRSEWEKRKSGN
ncbi:GNAT family N-acetyltransferase [Halobacillus halophilus]|uniref:GNAT family N-acetyltransferase n=1 Tax=Halobacillus halophilus TaxID=1570 RepID=UPI00192958C5|nr:GNAT family protein [Halobacillus halophilus]